MTTPDLLKSRGLVAFGRIAGVHGLQGALRVRADNPESANLDLIKRLFVERDGALVEHRVRSFARACGGSLKMHLEGIATIKKPQRPPPQTLPLTTKDL